MSTASGPTVSSAAAPPSLEQRQTGALARDQKRLLEMIAKGEPLAEILSELVSAMEVQSPDMLGSVLLVDPDGQHLRHGAAPSLARAFTQAIDGVATGAKAGSCGTAVFRRAQVISQDIATDPLWADWRALAAAHGLRACWSTPIFDTRGEVLGTFAMYFRQPGRPTARHHALIDVATQTAAIAINRHHAERALRESMLVLENTFEHMDQGISITDKDLRFFGVNRRFRELLDFPEDLCKPGLAFEPLLRYNAERGEYGPGDVEEQVRSRLELARRFEAHRFERERPDGTVLEVRGRPMPGGGFVTIYTDITERKRSEQRLGMRARQQTGIARVGQLALGRIEREPLFEAAIRALRDGGADAAALFEFTGEDGHYVVRAAAGEGSETSVGQTGNATSTGDGWNLAGASAIATLARGEIASRASGLPGASWDSTMGSALYTMLRNEEGGFGVLGAYALRDNAFGDEERRFVQTISALLSTAMQRMQAEQRLAYLAQFDTLTGLPNRDLLIDRLQLALVHAARGQRRLAVLFLDVDHFKLVNDTLGHYLGDRLIAQVAKRIPGCLRAGDTVGRISGDEFAAVLPELAHPDDAALVAGKILEALQAPFNLEGHVTFVTASIGIAVYPDDDLDAEHLLKDADAAMYRAKETGRGRFCFYTHELHERSLARLKLTNDLRHAIERGEFLLHYQPKMALASGVLAGLEALIRWQHPQRGMVAPMEFIPALEDSGLIVQVGDWVIREACAQLRQWSDAGLVLVPVAVNVSVRQFRSEDLASTIQRHIAAAGITPGLLELEITESCLMDNPKQAIHGLEALSLAGLKISIDDFGTGYSSLAYLTRLPLTALKIDRSFVRDLHTSADAAAIARAIIDMAHTLRFTVVAEGVETAEQADFLRKHGCEQGQGYLFARPLPAAEIAAWLQQPAVKP